MSETSTAQDTDPQVALHSMTLRYPIHRLRHPTLKHSITGMFQKHHDRTATLLALDDITFSLGPGDRLGIIGRNGAGKSSLLRVVAGIYSPTEGAIETRGFVIPLFQLGLGFHAELTPSANILQAAALLRLDIDQMSERIPSILSFADVEAFADVPIKYLSTGLAMRLAFTTATEFPPDILILDEVLTGGDADFRERATRRMAELMESTGIVLLVSHALPMVRRLCNRVIWLDEARIRMDGEPDEVIAAYQSSE